METKKLPAGVEFFHTIRKENFYYVDKTGLIKELLTNWSPVNLFTRPRRFGKTLNMDMLRCFFEIGQDKSLFDGLAISRETNLCQKYMGRFPVIFVSLKGVSGADFAAARAMLVSLLRDEARRFLYLLKSDRLAKQDKAVYEKFFDEEMTDDMICNSLRILSEFLCRHHDQKVILLIDEYDVPLDKAYHGGYYNEMTALIRNLMNQTLKTNEHLFFAVLTGCLRVSKESIFTGLNNVKVHSITDAAFDEYFGFTDTEVQEMLACYGASDRYDLVREWYEGYRFGRQDVYCPWDVINYCYDLRMDQNASPQLYWINTSGNDIIRKFIRRTKGVSQRRDIETLIEGGTVSKKIRQDLTYAELENSIENLWSVLFMTGYLTQRENSPSTERGILSLSIPNQEIRTIFKEQIYEWFNDSIRQEPQKLTEFCSLFSKGDATEIEKKFTELLSKTISIRDTSVRKSMKENFYHGYLLGLLCCMDDWAVTSNTESGDGYRDIMIEIEDSMTGIIIEVKYAENDRLEEQCANALRQIEEKHYEQFLIDEGYTTILKYGIACYRKRCRVVCFAKPQRQ